MGTLNTFVSSDYLQDIADAIREINESENEYLLQDMEGVIRELKLSEISIPESDETYTYDGIEYAVMTDEDDLHGVRYLSAAVVLEEGAEPVQVKVPLPEMISVRKKPAKRFYRVRYGDTCSITLNTAGMEVVRIFGDGDPEGKNLIQTLLDDDYTVSPATLTSGGTHVITVTYTFYGITYTDTFTVEVLDENNNVMVTDTYLRNIAAAIRAVTGKRRKFRVSEMAQAIRSLRWKDDPNVVEKIPTRYPCLEITRLPDTVHYETYTGGTVALSYKGIEVNILTADGERTNVTDKCTFLPAEGTVLTNAMAGLNIISVSCPTEDEYGAFTLYTSFEINLAVAEGGPHGVPVKIRVNKRPEKHAFVIGSSATSVKLDYKGLIIKAVYKDGFTKTITEECTIDPADGATVHERDGASEWTQKCTVEWPDKDTYRKFHTSFKLTIKDNNPNSSTMTKTVSYADPTKVTQTVVSGGTGTAYVVSTPTALKPKTTKAKKENVTDLKFAEYPVSLPAYVSLPNTFKDYVIYPALVRAKIDNKWKNIDKNNITWKTGGNGVTGTWNLNACRAITITATYKGRQCSSGIRVHGWNDYAKPFPNKLHLEVYEVWETNTGYQYYKETHKKLYDIYICSMWPISISEKANQYYPYYEINTSGSCTRSLMRKYGRPRGCGLRANGRTSIGNSISYQVPKTTSDNTRYGAVYFDSNWNVLGKTTDGYRKFAFDYYHAYRYLAQVQWVTRVRKV